MRVIAKFNYVNKKVKIINKKEKKYYSYVKEKKKAAFNIKMNNQVFTWLTFVEMC